MSSTSSNNKDIQQALAEQRTDQALHRTLLAEQRTYSAWVRTGLAAVATGIAIAKFMEETDPRWLVVGLGAVFQITGAIMFLLAYWTYRAGLKRLNLEQRTMLPLNLLSLLTLAMTIAAGAGVWLILR